MPDVLNYRDLAEAPHHLERMAARRGRYPSEVLHPPRVGKLSSFPYPKLVGIRDMTQITVIDRLVLRAIVARIGGDTDRTLGPRMYANRLATTGPNWALRDYPAAYAAFHQGQIDSLEQHGWQYTLITDLRRFYPSINRDLLAEELRARSTDAEAIGTLCEMLAVWQDRDGLHGLPVGDEGCGVLAMVTLGSTDALLRRVAAEHFLYSDDLTMFAPTAESGQAARAAVTEHLASLGFQLNLDKTYEFTNPDDAANEVANFQLNYIDDLSLLRTDMAREAIYELWHEIAAGGGIDQPRRLTEVHYVLSKLNRAGDAYAVEGLLRRPDIIQITPKNVVKYLLDVAPSDPRVVDKVLELVQAPITPANQALILHGFRYLGAEQRDDRLRVACEKVLGDPKAHPATRAWAAIAFRQAPSWRCSETLERAEAEPDFIVCRAELASTKGSDEVPLTRRRMLCSIGKERVEMAATCEYAQRAA